jgi:hypothetical protein
MHVLYIDEYEESADALVKLTTLLGHNAAVAYSCEEALVKAREFLPHILPQSFEFLVRDRTKIVNQTRAFLLEFGVSLPSGSSTWRAAITGYHCEAY